MYVDDNIESIERSPGEEEEEGDECEEDVSPLPSPQLPHLAAGGLVCHQLVTGDVEGPGDHDVGHGDDDERDNVLDEQAGHDIGQAGVERRPGLEILKIRNIFIYISIYLKMIIKLVL